MSKSLMSKVASALSFAHLAGQGGNARAESDPPADEPKKDDEPKAEDEDPKKKRDDETADEYATRMEADEAAAAAAAVPPVAAVVPVADIQAAARAEGVTAERARGAAIFGAAAAARNTQLAAELTFTTDLSAERVVALLERAPAARNLNRAANNPTVGTFAGPTATPKQAAADRMDAHLKAATPQPRKR